MGYQDQFIKTIIGKIGFKAEAAVVEEVAEKTYAEELDEVVQNLAVIQHEFQHKVFKPAMAMYHGAVDTEQETNPHVKALYAVTDAFTELAKQIKIQKVDPANEEEEATDEELPLDEGIEHIEWEFNPNNQTYSEDATLVGHFGNYELAFGHSLDKDEPFWCQVTKFNEENHGEAVLLQSAKELDEVIDEVCKFLGYTKEEIGLNDETINELVNAKETNEDDMDPGANAIETGAVTESSREKYRVVVTQLSPRKELHNIIFDTQDEAVDYRIKMQNTEDYRKGTIAVDSYFVTESEDEDHKNEKREFTDAEVSRIVSTMNINKWSKEHTMEYFKLSPEDFEEIQAIRYAPRDVYGNSIRKKKSDDKTPLEEPSEDKPQAVSDWEYQAHDKAFSGCRTITKYFNTATIVIGICNDPEEPFFAEVFKEYGKQTKDDIIEYGNSLFNVVQLMLQALQDPAFPEFKDVYDEADLGLTKEVLDNLRISTNEEVKIPEGMKEVPDDETQAIAAKQAETPKVGKVDIGDTKITKEKE
jgi:hypothetical protein